MLLVNTPLTDAFLADYIMDMRTATNNELITAEQVDLASLHSIRRFATKWVDNAPPRRLDMLILCGGTITPSNSGVQLSHDGVEANFAVNYLANFHLLSILSPAIRAQPPDRDVRVIFGTCSSYMGGVLPAQVPVPSTASISSKTKSALAQSQSTPAAAYATSKLALMTFALAFEKHLSSYARPDKQPANARVLMVDPGWSRTPGMRRYLAGGSLWGLLVYLIMWPLWWLVLKSPEQGAQTFLHAAMEAEYGRGQGGVLLKECREVKIARMEILDEDKQKALWQLSDKAIEALEKESAMRRAKEKAPTEKDVKVEEIKIVAADKPTAATTQKVGSRRNRKA